MPPLAALGMFLLATGLAAGLASLRALKGQSCPTIYDLSYGFGPTISAILREHRFGMQEWGGNYWTYAHRLPFVPLFLAALTLIFHSVPLILLAKNLLAALLWLYAVARVTACAAHPLTTCYTLLALTYLLPYNTGALSQINIEESYLFFMLAALIAVILTRSGSDYAKIALLVAAIYLTKSSLALVCVASAAWVVWQDKRCRGLRAVSLLPLTALLLASLAWGSYIYARTGVFAIGVNASSWNGWNLHKGNNPLAVVLYPRIDLDTLDDSHYLDPPLDAGIHDEWSKQRWELEMGSRYIKEHPREVLRMDRSKLAVMLYDVGESPRRMPARNRLLLGLALAIDHLAFAFALYLAVKYRDANAAFFCLLAACYIAPYLSGFLYQRHMLPLYGAAFFYTVVTLRKHLPDRWSVPEHKQTPVLATCSAASTLLRAQTRAP